MTNKKYWKIERTCIKLNFRQYDRQVTQRYFIVMEKLGSDQPITHNESHEEASHHKRES